MLTTLCPICGEGMRDEALDTRNSLLRCPRCGHVLRDLRLCPAGARDAAYGGDAGLDALRLELTRRRLERLVPSGGRVFEMGFGSGELLRRLHADGFEVAGVESGQAGLARRAELPPDALRHGDAAAVRLAAGEAPYDLVVAVHVIEHVADPLAVLGAARRMVRPGGSIVLVTPSADSLGLRWFGAAWWMLEDPTHVAFFTPDSMRRALVASGFADVAIRRPLLESLSCEAASVRRRRLTTGRTSRAVLSRRSTVALAAATLPVTVVARLVRPRLRPALLVTARRPVDVI